MISHACKEDNYSFSYEKLNNKQEDAMNYNLNAGTFQEKWIATLLK